MPQRRDVAQLASAAWFNFRAENTKRRRVDDLGFTGFTEGIDLNRNETLKSAAEYATEIDEIDNHRAYIVNKLQNAVLRLDAEQKNYLNNMTPENEALMMDCRCEVVKYLRERCETVFDGVMLRLMKKWAEAKETAENETAENETA